MLFNNNTACLPDISTDNICCGLNFNSGYYKCELSYFYQRFIVYISGMPTGWSRNQQTCMVLYIIRRFQVIVVKYLDTLATYRLTVWCSRSCRHLSTLTCQWPIPISSSMLSSPFCQCPSISNMVSFPS